MIGWLPKAILATLCWGLWAFFPRLAADHASYRSLTLFQAVGSMLAAFLLLALTPGRLELHPLGVTFGILSGFSAIVGFYFYTLAMQQGNSSVVLTMTSLYPLVTLILFAIFFREALSIRQGVGICLAVFAMYLLSH